jgi:hypothetical protein
VATRSVSSIARKETEKTTSSSATPTETQPACLTCRGPVVSHADACLFCRARFAAPPVSLVRNVALVLTYLAKCLPGAEIGRGRLGDGPIRQLRLVIGGEEYLMRQRKNRLELSPPEDLGFWLESLLISLTEAAATDLELRATLSRAGWAWRLQSNRLP